MSKQSHIWYQGIYEKYLCEGRGQRNGKEYKPWIRVQNFSSQGVISRVKGRKSGRVHHLMSNNELAYFYLLDWSDEVTDICEQYPLLDLDSAVDIAARAGIKYPYDNINGFPYVLTTDFMITTKQDIKARTVKMSSELTKERVLEKLEIERRYWEKNGIDWKIVTENEISYVKAKNIEWLYSAQDFNAESYESELSFMIQLFKNNGCSVMEAVRLAEEKFLLETGVGLTLFKYLALNKKIIFKISEKLNLNDMKVSVVK